MVRHIVINSNTDDADLSALHDEIVTIVNRINSTEDPSEPKPHRGIWWSSFSVRNFIGTETFLFPCAGMVHCGEILCVVGDSFSGKTTLLNGLTNNLESLLKRGGIASSMQHITTYSSEINRYFLEEFSVIENIYFVTLDHNQPSQETIKNIFGKYQNYKAKELPLYMKHILTLFLAELQKSKIILHDEPFTGLIKEEVLKVLQMFERLKNKNRAIIFTCNPHDFTEQVDKPEYQKYFMLLSRNVYSGPTDKFIKMSKETFSFLRNINSLKDNQSYITYLLNHQKNPDESEENTRLRQRELIINWSDKSILNDPKPDIILDYETDTFVGKIVKKSQPILQMMMSKINVFIWLLTLIIPEIIMFGLSFLWDNVKFYNDQDIKIKTQKKFYNFSKGYILLSNEDFQNIVEHLDIVKNRVTGHDNERYTKEIALNSFISNFISEKFLTLFIFRYFFLTQFLYTGYFFKNTIMNRYNNCSFIDYDLSIVFVILSRLPNIIIEALTNLAVIYRLFFINTQVILKYLIIHSGMSIAAILYNFHLLRHTSNNLGLIVFKSIIFIGIYTLLKLWKGFRIILAQIFIYQILTNIGREIIIVLSLLSILIFLLKISLFSS